MEFLYEMNTNIEKSCEFNLIEEDIDSNEEEITLNSEDENEDEDVDEVDWLFDTEWLIHCQLVEVRTLASFADRRNCFLKIDNDVDIELNKFNYTLSHKKIT
jgi:hypothetical protein